MIFFRFPIYSHYSLVEMNIIIVFIYLCTYKVNNNYKNSNFIYQFRQSNYYGFVSLHLLYNRYFLIKLRVALIR